MFCKCRLHSISCTLPSPLILSFSLHLHPVHKLGLLSFAFRIWTEVSQSILAAPLSAPSSPQCGSLAQFSNSLCPLSLLPPLPPAAQNPPLASCLTHNQSQCQIAPQGPCDPLHTQSPSEPFSSPHSGLLLIPGTSQTSHTSVSNTLAAHSTQIALSLCILA